MNNRFRPFYVGALAVAGVALLGSSLIPRAKADEGNKVTIVTVNETIIAGNKVLQPGTYVWKLLDSNSDRHIVQIFDKDQRHLEQTILAIPDYRLQPTTGSRFAFWETPSGVPRAVRAWFYPGDNFGQEFVYPKKLVAQLAAVIPVAAVYHPEPPLVAAAEAIPVPTQEAEPVAVPQPEVVPASVPLEQQATPAPQALPAVVPQSLPHTGSNAPLFALFGLTSLSGAGLLSLTERKV